VQKENAMTKKELWDFILKRLLKIQGVLAIKDEVEL